MISRALLHSTAAYIDGSLQARAAVARIVARFGEAVVHFTFARGIRIRALLPGENFATVSPVIARTAPDIAQRSHAPAGLFVVAEKTAYLRSVTPMSIAHEFAHGVDCALGAGGYYSERSAAVRAAFADATRFVTPYAAVGIDEYFAESMRAYVAVNDPASPWPNVSRAKLRRYDPAMYAILAEIFSDPSAAANAHVTRAPADAHV